MRVWLFLIFLGFVLPARAQPELEIFPKSVGLSSDQVSCMVRDSLGFLWVGTWNGLNRYDGATFRNYFFEGDAERGLPNDLIYDLLVTRAGLLLIATGDGMAVINPANGRFENHRVEHPEIRAGGGHAIHGLYQDPEGQVWVNHDGEFDILSPDLRFVERFSDRSWATGLKGASTLFEDWQMDAAGRLWIPSDTSGLQIVDFQAKTVFNHRHNPDGLPYLKHRFIRSFLLDEGSDRLWLGPWGAGLLGFSLRAGTLEVEPLAGYPTKEGRSINMIFRRADGVLVFSWTGDMYQFDPVSASLEQFGYFSYYPDKVDLIAACAIDETHFFLGSTNRGLLDARTSDLVARQDLGKSLEGVSLHRLFELPGMGIFGLETDGSIWALDPQDLHVLKSFHPPSNPTGFLAETTDGRKIWTVGLDGFLLFDALEGTYLRAPVALDTFRGWLVSAIHIDDREGLWIATREPASLWRLDIPTGRLERVPDRYIEPLTSHGHISRIDLIEPDDKGVLWFASVTSEEIVSYDPVSEAWTIHPDTSIGRQGFPGEGVQSLQPQAGKIWMTMTSGNGLLSYDPGTGKVDVLSRSQGMPSSRLFILPSKASRELWLLSESNLVVFDPIKQRILRQWSLSREIFPQWIHMPPVLLTSHGPILINGNRLGLLRTPDLSREPLIPLVTLDAMSVNNRDIPFDAQSDTLILLSPDRNVSLDFVLVDLAGELTWELSYRLLGLDTSWTLAGRLRRVTYTHLRPGHYAFEVKVTHPFSDLAGTTRLISFQILPPLWQRWWFIFATLGSFLTLAIGAVRWRVRSIRKAAALKLEMNELEMKALQAQMNPHFIFNCLNSIDALVHGNEKHLATQFLNKFARLIRNVLDSSRNNVTPFSKDVETLRLYVELEQFRHDNRFEVEWDVDPQLLRGDFQVPPLIIQPFVENAILHGLGPRQEPGGMLRIGISRAGDHVRYLIEDNGVGRTQSQDTAGPARISHGIRMTLDRIRLFNKETEPSVTITDRVEDGRPAGTRVEVGLVMA